MSGILFQNTTLTDVIELKNVSVSYDRGKTHVIKDFSYLVEDKPNQGQFDVIVGTSGCGKSTILRLIAGLQQPTSGEVLIDGEIGKRKSAISMVFQQYSSLPWKTVLQNVMLPLQFLGVAFNEAKERAMKMLELVHLTKHAGKFAQYPLLSGGQLQRVAIARSLVANPRIILMDEPFGALDAYTRYVMQNLIEKIWEEYQPTIIFVTHDKEEAVFLADNIYVMSSNPGTIVKHIAVDLGFHRDRQTKRQVRFHELVNEVEDALIQTAELSKLKELA